MATILPLRADPPARRVELLNPAATFTAAPTLEQIVAMMISCWRAVGRRGY